MGLIGTISIVHEIKPSLAIITEFGEELGNDRCRIAQALDREAGKNKRCLTGDIGLKVRLSDLAINCDICGKYIDVMNVVETNIKAREEVIYHCENHTVQELADRLIV